MLPSASLSWFVWSLGAAFFLVAFFHRVAPAVLHRELSQDFGLSAAALGGLSGLYFYSYVAMQVPTGLLVDRWGPRWLLVGGLFLSAIGAVVFATASTLFWAGVGRFLIGGSVAVAFVCVLKLATHWLPAQRYALAAGLLLVVGMTGAVFGGVPLQFASNVFGWRAVVIAAAGVSLILALLVWLVVRDDPSDKGYRGYIPVADAGDLQTGEVDRLRAVLRYRNTWLLALAPGGIVGSVLAFAGLWGMPFLTDIYQLTPVAAASVCSGMMLCWAFSGPLFGMASEKLRRRRVPYAAGNFVALLAWALVVLVPDLPVWVLVSALMLAGLSSGGMILGFAQAKESVPLRLAGTVSGLVNMGVMCGPMLLQPLVGWVLDWFWQGNVGADGLRVYLFESYRIGFLMLLLWLVVSVVCVLASHETCCRQSPGDKV
ncbi:MAG TPA: MFS transporter [Gammaproteobacteria bacterium]|nr:MFS transporter [Acidiferrobacteraceae bacterium]HCV21574.1 MFS transporter [Gammaproteobacteria bacterium]